MLNLMALGWLPGGRSKRAVDTSPTINPQVTNSSAHINMPVIWANKPENQGLRCVAI